MATKKKAPVAQPPATLQSIIAEMQELTFFEDPNLLSFGATPSDNPACKVAVIYGDNASGKSFIRRIIHQYVHEAFPSNLNLLQVGMQTRTAEGFGRMMYTPLTDAQNSSGVVSLSPLDGLFNTADKSTSNTFLSVDEVEVCLNPAYHHALGELLALKWAPLNERDSVKGFVIVTHSRELVRGLVSRLGFTPIAIGAGDCKGLSLQQWLDSAPVRKTLEELEALPAQSRERYIAIENRLRAE